ncbi:hypothetical protein GALMADRAFT_142378 [Galerina marginata CBS 339.88]|uniref:Uncharacterized protein n=1 Tax=Galerina marginata (strain CBS 339.88) TaxID=685588 RepID=A0A067T2J2_GALM3|nr:hypothetical protein GALMADRAFT_142378 [Galerina marginata CBS 339.88]
MTIPARSSPDQNSQLQAANKFDLDYMRLQSLPHQRPFTSSTQEPHLCASRCGATARLPTNVASRKTRMGPDSNLLITFIQSIPSFPSTQVRLASPQTSILHAVPQQRPSLHSLTRRPCFWSTLLPERRLIRFFVGVGDGHNPGIGDPSSSPYWEERLR